MHHQSDSSSELVGDAALRIKVTVVVSQVQMLTEAVPEANALGHAEASNSAASLLALPKLET